MNSVYHILYKEPAIYAEDMSVEYEDLVHQLLNSGRVRIDTNYYSNFVRYTDNKLKINLTFSYKELTEKQLIPQTKQIIQNSYLRRKRSLSDEKLSSIIAKLHKETKKLLLPYPELTLRLTRILVQSAHPIVIRWLLLDRVEIFITYSHSIGDTMSIADWKRSGENSGMQSTDGMNVIIYVSCGGDPFGQSHPEYPQYGDGWAALARMQIIAAQEIGHYADIVRNQYGQQITRHSANFSCTKAKDNVAKARLDDIYLCKNTLKTLMKNGLAELIDSERQLKFYDQQKISNIKTLYIKVKIYFQKKTLLENAQKIGLLFPAIFYRKERYMGLQIQSMIEDMLTHLTPVADVYKNANPDIEEAIACAESLARIPQQAVKWGHVTTRETMKGLYKIYYKQVIPSLIENYEKYTGKKFRRQYQKLSDKQHKIIVFIKRLYRLIKKDRIKFSEVRDI